MFDAVTESEASTVVLQSLKVLLNHLSIVTLQANIKL